MTPEELYQAAEDVLRRCNSSGVTTENAAQFIEQLQAELRGIGGWLPPANGTVGYADSQVIDQLRQLKFHSENVLANFPRGVEALSERVENFRQYLMANYPIRSDRVQDASNG